MKRFIDSNRKIKSFKEICEIASKLKKKGKKIVLVHGFFDVLHKGHVTLLVEAKKLGNVLVVGIDHDDNAKILKGPNRPINNHDSRMFVVANMEPVDYVFLIGSIKGKNINLIEDFYCQEIYKRLAPDIVASCLKAGKHGHLKKKQAEDVGAKFVDINLIYDIHTTNILKIFGLE